MDDEVPVDEEVLILCFGGLVVTKEHILVSSVNVSLFTVRFLKHSLKTLVRFFSSSSCNCLVCVSCSLSRFLDFCAFVCHGF